MAREIKACNSLFLFYVSIVLEYEHWKWALLFEHKYGMHYRHPSSSNHSLHFFIFIFFFIFLINQAVCRIGVSNWARTKIITIENIYLLHINIQALKQSVARKSSHMSRLHSGR